MTGRASGANDGTPPPGGGGLGALYPHLRARGDRSKDATASLLQSIRSKVDDSVRVKRAFFDAHAETLVAMARALADVYRAGGRLFTMGNGGSACDAAHVAVEFMHPITVGRPALPAHQLGAELPMATAIGNDVGFQAVYSRQLEALGRAGDAVLGLSTSGNSDNLLVAFRRARELGMVTMAFAGGDGGRMASGGAVDHCLVVDTPSVHRVQESHVAAYHVLWDLVHTLLADDRRARTPSRGPQGDPNEQTPTEEETR